MPNNLVGALLDHLVLATDDLEKTVAAFERATGVRPVPGGRHEGRGLATTSSGSVRPPIWRSSAQTWTIPRSSLGSRRSAWMN